MVKMIRYEATVSTGLEFIAQDEVKSKLKTESTIGKGRVWFSSDEPVNKLIKLKSICNLYVIIYDQILEPNQMPTDSSSLEALLMEVGDKCDWVGGLNKWVQIKSFDMMKALEKNINFRCLQPKFRVSCNRFGATHKFTSPEVCSIFGHVIDTKFGWPIKMKDFDMEVMVHFNERHLYVGFTLTDTSLDCRNIVATGLTTLRAATCYSLLRLAEIECADIVIDPMAGSGAIPVECCSAWSDEWLAYTLNGELRKNPLEKSKVNLEALTKKVPYDILRLNVVSLPFRQNSIDVFVSDLPFGKRHGSRKVNQTLYPALLRDMGRVARVGSGRAVLLTQDFKSMNLAEKLSGCLWNRKICTFVKVGNLVCYIYLFHRNDTKFLDGVQAK